MKRKPAVICCGVLLAIILSLVVVFVALYFTVFRPRSPRVVATVVSSRISAFNPIPPPVLKLSFDVKVTVDNPNYAAFQYGDVVTEVMYHGAAVGQTVVPAGEIGARTTKTVVTTVEVDAVKVAFSPFFLPEALVGVLPFNTTTTVAGKAVVLGKFKIRASSVVTCDITVYPIRQESIPHCASTVHVG